MKREWIKSLESYKGLLGVSSKSSHDVSLLKIANTAKTKKKYYYPLP